MGPAAARATAALVAASTRYRVHLGRCVLSEAGACGSGRPFAAARTARASSLALGYRSAGSFAIALVTTLSKAAGTSGAIRLKLGGVDVASTTLSSSAVAGTGTPGQRETVCAETLAVRTDSNAWLGELRRGQTFRVERVDGHWAYGFAYGEINYKGKVDDGWFC